MASTANVIPRTLFILLFPFQPVPACLLQIADLSVTLAKSNRNPLDIRSTSARHPLDLAEGDLIASAVVEFRRGFVLLKTKDRRRNDAPNPIGGFGAAYHPSPIIHFVTDAAEKAGNTGELEANGREYIAFCVAGGAILRALLRRTHISCSRCRRSDACQFRDSHYQAEGISMRGPVCSTFPAFEFRRDP